MIQLIVLTILFFCIEYAYIQLADKYNIIDKPNERSSHTKPTIRGGGIIFPIAWLAYFIIEQFPFPYFTLGLILVSIVSFSDDIKPISNRIRLLVHFISFSLCFYELGLFTILPLWFIVCFYIVAIGCLNAINFMDGINGMTGLYAIAIFLPILFERTGNVYYNPMTIICLSIIVFGYFNFRKKAMCFAGDVGSVSIAYIIIFFVIGFMFHRWHIVDDEITLKPALYTDFSLRYILLLTLYGVDTILTLIHRMYLKENIFKAHRKHVYQYLANELKWSHLGVALVYALIQFVLNLWIMTTTIPFVYGLLIVLFFSFVYFVLKRWIHKEIQLKQLTS
jgi:UDP-GlcNAc:undecaprenyl-phosphate/decaprenyl-phosphate GlcNAc-1-phosphate transferase